MTGRGMELLEAHLRSLDPDEPTARERLEDALGETLARELVLSLLSADNRGEGRGENPRLGSG